MEEHHTNQFLLNTKLTIPPARSDSITRPSLLQRLQTASAHPLTLIAAPTGFGKTTLLSEWAQHSIFLPIGVV